MRRAHIDADGRLDLGDQARRAGYQPGTTVDVLVTLAGQLIITPTDEPVLIELDASRLPKGPARRAITARVVPSVS